MIRIFFKKRTSSYHSKRLIIRSLFESLETQRFCLVLEINTLLSIKREALFFNTRNNKLRGARIIIRYAIICFMKKAMLFALVIIGVTVSAQEIPSRIQEVFDTTNTETTYYKKGWYRYDVSNGEELIVLQRKLFQSSESWVTLPNYGKGLW